MRTITRSDPVDLARAIARERAARFTASPEGRLLAGECHHLACEGCRNCCGPTWEERALVSA